MKQNEEIARQLLYTLNAYNWAVNRYSNEKMEEIDIGHIIKVLSAKDQEYEGRIEELEKELATCRELSDLRLEGESKYRKEAYQLQAKLSAAEKLEPICCSLVDAWKSLIHIITSRLHYHDSVFEVSCVICQDINVSCKNVKIAEQAIQAYQALKECEK